MAVLWALSSSKGDTDTKPWLFFNAPNLAKLFSYGASEPEVLWVCTRAKST